MSSAFEDYSTETIRKLQDPGLLLVSTDKKGKSNVMTIGWGLIGVFWSTPVFMIAIRKSRYTYDLIEESGEFTVNVPKGDMRKIVEYCGEASGRDHDKIADCRLTLQKAKRIGVPVIKECNMHYECQVIQSLSISPRRVPPDVNESIYPKGNYHKLYFGKILEVY